ncbi:MAG: hypothetical protein KIT34_16430 [Cyanobacteria bacterium TGS_CYA1]|nr:hypothetical protein [Cyanobacteria bacterium TGS_CYA1]
MSVLSKLKPTPVFDSYLSFAVERQNIFWKRLQGKAFPWSNDSILSNWKFTNTYRVLDRVSQYLVSEVIGRSEQNIEDLFFRIILFKIFNRIETWQLLERELQEISWRTYDFARYDAVLSRAKNSLVPIYSMAYVMPSPGTVFGEERKHQNHLRLLEFLFANRVPHKIANAKSMQEVFETLRQCPSFGNFLAFQYAIDLNYSDIIDFSEMDFVIAGPGAKDGIAKCFEHRADYTSEAIIEIVTKNLDALFDSAGLKFNNLYGRPLQLIDCQNIFCEISKYARIAYPEYQGVSGRTRIKQKYKTAQSALPPVALPPKWGLGLKNEDTNSDKNVRMELLK